MNEFCFFFLRLEMSTTIFMYDIIKQPKSPLLCVKVSI